MKTLSEKIIEQLLSKHDAFLGTKEELSRQRFKDGIMWAIDTIETLTEVDNCQKKYEAEQLILTDVVVAKPEKKYPMTPKERKNYELLKSCGFDCK